ncbi:MAG: KpsF/GutQ family sugar-phosphate isomerase [Pseudomonadota bacterium]
MGTDSLLLHPAAVRTVEQERDGLSALIHALHTNLAASFMEAIAAIERTRGRVVVTGIGKSGHVARKIAATLASTGTPAHFVHPAEASHGDLGMITGDDAVLALSWSGQTVELRAIVDYTRRFSIPLIGVTSDGESALGEAADIVLALPIAPEACPNGLAPTTSTTVQLVFGDALAVTLLERRGFTASDFRDFHPGGKLGAKLRMVADLMHTGASLPLVSADTAMSQAVLIMTEKCFGCVGVVDDEGRLVGIVTDGDLRRHMDADLMARAAGSIMTETPKVIESTALAASAMDVLSNYAITSLFVVKDEKPVGILHIHDLLRVGVV